MEYRFYELGDPILRKRSLEFRGLLNIVLDGETEVNRLWNMEETRKRLSWVCNEVGGLSYLGPVPHSVRVETSFGPAFDVIFDEAEEKMLRITIKRSREQEERTWIDFNYQDKGLEMDYRR